MWIDSRKLFETLVETKVETEARSISKEHTRVATRESSKPIILIDFSHFLTIRHGFMLSHLRPGLKQIKEEGDVRVAPIKKHKEGKPL